MRNKILYGFVILGLLLFFSGAVSLFELMRLSDDTLRVMNTNRSDLELTKRMLDAVQEQNAALLQYASGAGAEAEAAVADGKRKFDAAFDEAFGAHKDTDRLTDVELARENYRRAVDSLFADSLSDRRIPVFAKIYATSYRDLTQAVKTFMLSTQEVVDSSTQLLRNNAYRAITPGIITLGVAIIIIIVFFGLIDLYYIKPVMNINKSLGDYVKLRVPFKVKVEGQDEVQQLKEHIEELAEIVKKKEQ